jgi:hypothetical protein
MNWDVTKTILCRWTTGFILFIYLYDLGLFSIYSPTFHIKDKREREVCAVSFKYLI